MSSQFTTPAKDNGGKSDILESRLDWSAASNETYIPSFDGDINGESSPEFKSKFDGFGSGKSESKISILTVPSS